MSLGSVLFLLAALQAAQSSAPANAPNRAIRYRVDVPAPVASVWSAWTDAARVAEWFAPAANIELRPLGRYEILFKPDAPAGLRGAEDNFVLAVQEPALLSFTWNAPPHLPQARAQRTSVVVRFEALAPDRTRVWFEQTGWGKGGEWDKAFEYFTSAWKSVLTLLHRRFDEGPIDWGAPPSPDRLAERARFVETW